MGDNYARPIWKTLFVIAALLAIAIFVWSRIELWQARKDRDQAPAEFTRFEDYAVQKKTTYVDELALNDVYIGHLEGELEAATGELDTALALNVRYRGIIAKGTAVPDVEISPDEPAVTFRFDDGRRYKGYFVFPTGEYEIAPYPISFRIIAVADSSGWTFVIDAEQVAEDLGISVEEASKLFFIADDVVVKERDRSPKWYNKISVSAAAGWTDTFALELGAGYGPLRLRVQGEPFTAPPGATGVFLGGDWTIFPPKL